MKAGWRDAGLSGRRRAICLYAERSTRSPSAMTEEDLAPLRAAGLADEELLALAHVIAFFNGANRVAECLNVDPEPG